MKRLTRFSTYVTALILALFMTVGSSAYAADKVGISLPEAQNPFYVLLGKALTEGLAKHGFEAVVLSANADVNEQISNVNDLIAARVKLIIMSPLNLDGPAPAVQAANDAGIPVIMIARRLDDKYKHLWKAFVGFNIETVGRKKGDWLVENRKPGNVAMLLGPEGALFAIEQDRGFRQVVEPANFKVVFAQNSSQTRENGLKLAEDALIKNPDLVAIYASNDDVALGAAQAVKGSGLQGKVAVLGTNGTPPAVAAVYRGDMAATIQLDPFAWGFLGADTAAKYLQDQKIDNSFVEFQSVLVDKANACERMPPHLREEFELPKECR
ncbi:MAG: ABC transporter substrate-binding protein [Gammaproteobacteria bacterium]|nr:ABC transporter substrate-binding protein [Gammaproteobacteria bacterium]